MKYDPKIHHRRSIRLKGYDYAQAGAYFITICCDNRKNRFGKIINGEMILNELGQIAFEEWVKLGKRFDEFELDVFQIMPNHFHSIIILNDSPVRATLAVAQFTHPASRPASHPTLAVAQSTHPASHPTLTNINDNEFTQNGTTFSENTIAVRAGASPAPTIGDIIGAYKSLVANACLEIYKSRDKTMGKFWQRNYYEHIIRNEKSYQNISDYIINNPMKWEEDKFHNRF